MPELHFLIVTGPRIDPASLPRRTGVRVRGFLPDLDQYLAACDVAVVQGGLSTCMELTAAGTPFIYVPLEHHFEQNFHVRHRLEQYGAGRAMSYADAADPDRLAQSIVEEASHGQRRFAPSKPTARRGQRRCSQNCSETTHLVRRALKARWGTGFGIATAHAMLET